MYLNTIGQRKNCRSTAFVAAGEVNRSGAPVTVLWNGRAVTVKLKALPAVAVLGR